MRASATLRRGRSVKKLQSQWKALKTSRKNNNNNNKNRCRCMSSEASYEAKRAVKIGELEETLPELRATRALESLVSGKKHLQDSASSQLPTPIWTEAFPGKDLEVLVDAALATFALHVESRIASAIGEGFYTIGPCGEEALAAVG